MACICGCGVLDHLSNLPNRPASPNTLFDDFTSPDFVKLLTSRLETVLQDSEPSRRVLWREFIGGEAQDTANPRHQWARPPPTFPDQSRGCEAFILREVTPNFKEITKEEQVIQEELMQEWHGDSGSLGGAQKSPNPTDRGQQPQISLQSANEAMKISPTSPLKTTTSSSAGEFDQKSSFPFGQVCITSCASPPVDEQHHDLEKDPYAKTSFHIGPNTQAPDDSMTTEGDIRITANQKADGVDSGNSFARDLHGREDSILSECLCGCGGHAMHCLRPNRPPSPNTFHENFWAPNFSDILQARLRGIAEKLEPSRRIWWREEFGGCAPDRNPLTSEIVGLRRKDLGNVLRTSPPPFLDDETVSRMCYRTRFRSYRNRSRSTTSLRPPIPSHDEPADVLPRDFAYQHCDAFKSLPVYNNRESSAKRFPNYWANVSSHHSVMRTMTSQSKTKSSRKLARYVPGRIPLLKIAPTNGLSATRIPPMEEKSEALRQQSETKKERGQVRRGINFDRYWDIAGESALPIVGGFPVTGNRQLNDYWVTESLQIFPASVYIGDSRQLCKVNLSKVQPTIFRTDVLQ